jgi:16S rRNA (guanine527-N7)-methyltransferase
VEQTYQLSSLLKESSAEIGVPLNANQVQLFMAYLQQLQLWNRSVNLTGITSDEQIIIKHFVDSLAVLKIDDIRIGSRLLDVGTGAGFPGIPLKIARPDLNVCLVEPVRKKSSFLRFIVGLLRLERVDIFEETLEQFMIKHPPDGLFDYITTRALKFDVILEKGARLLRDKGKTILFSSQPIIESDLLGSWLLTNEYEFDLPCGYGQRVISTVSPSS